METARTRQHSLSQGPQFTFSLYCCLLHCNLDAPLEFFQSLSSCLLTSMLPPQLHGLLGPQAISHQRGFQENSLEARFAHAGSEYSVVLLRGCLALKGV